MSVRGSGGVKSLTYNSNNQFNKSEDYTFNPFALEPQCYNAVWSGLSGDLAAFTELTGGSFYYVGICDVGPDAVNPTQAYTYVLTGSTFSPPRLINRTAPAPVTHGSLTLQFGYGNGNRIIVSYLPPAAGIVQVVLDYSGWIWQKTLPSPQPGMLDLSGTYPVLSGPVGSSVTLTQSI